MPVCDQWTPCLHMNTYAVTRIYPPPFTPSPPTPRSWLLCCCHGDTKPCTLKSALRRSRGETDNNIPISRQTDTHTSAQTLVFVEVIITRFGGAGVCVCVCVCAGLCLCVFMGGGCSDVHCLCMCKQIASGEIELHGQTRQVEKICCVLNMLHCFRASCV